MVIVDGDKAYNLDFVSKMEVVKNQIVLTMENNDHIIKLKSLEQAKEVFFIINNNLDESVISIQEILEEIEEEDPNEKTINQQYTIFSRLSE